MKGIYYIVRWWEGQQTRQDVEYKVLVEFLKGLEESGLYVISVEMQGIE